MGVFKIDHGLRQRRNVHGFRELDSQRSQQRLIFGVCAICRLIESAIVRTGARELQERDCRSLRNQTGSHAGDAGSCGTAVLAVMAVNVDWSIKLEHGFGQFVRASFGDAVIAVRQMNVSQAMLLRHRNIRPGSIDADDCFYAQVGEFPERGVIFRQPS